MSTGASEPVQSTAVKWLLAQGAPTVLLACILGFLGYCALKVVPAIMEAQSAALKETRDDFKFTLKEQRTDFMEALKRFEAILRESEQERRHSTFRKPDSDNVREFAKAVEKLEAKGDL